LGLYSCHDFQRSSCQGANLPEEISRINNACADTMLTPFVLLEAEIVITIQDLREI